MQTARKPKHAELSDRILAFYSASRDRGEVNEFVFRRLMDDSKAICSVREFAIYGYSFQAVLHSIKGDREQAFEAFAKSEALGGQTLSMQQTKCTVLSTFGELQLAAVILRSILDQVVLPEELCNQFGLALSCGLFEMAEVIYQRLQKLQMADRLDPSQVETYRTLGELKIQGVSEDDLLVRLQVAASAIGQKTNALLWGGGVWKSEFGISIAFTLHASIEQLIELDIAIADALVTQFDDPMDQFFSIFTAPYVDIDASNK